MTKLPSVVCTVPSLPHSKLGPNARLHYKQKNRLLQSAKDTMILELRNQNCLQDPLWEQGHLDIQFVAPDKRRRDIDNLVGACKGWIDALVGEVIVDDSADRLTLSVSYRLGDKAATIFTIKKLL
jgi:Holliday junction resolvase RusA-like endonuclease